MAKPLLTDELGESSNPFYRLRNLGPRAVVPDFQTGWL